MPIERVTEAKLDLPAYGGGVSAAAVYRVGGDFLMLRQGDERIKLDLGQLRAIVEAMPELEKDLAEEPKDPPAAAAARPRNPLHY